VREAVMRETWDGRPEREHMERVWRDRADRLAQRPVFAEAGQDAVGVIVLGIGKERYGIELADVAEVLAPLRATPVPGAAAVFSGIVNVHGEIRPVIDLRRFLGMETIPTGAPARMILMRKGGREVGLQIDSVEQIRWIGAADFQTAGDGESGRSGWIKATTKDRLTLIGTEALFAALETGVIF
jgi:purine-binding chemotaxis protein CheW